MAIHYSHLNKTERTRIKDWKNRGISLREIGRRLNRSHTTIGRELRRNLWCGRHFYIWGAQEIYGHGLKRSSAVPFENGINKTLRAPKFSYRVDT